jgi:mannan polymerase II complex MNN10 subunit
MLPANVIPSFQLNAGSMLVRSSQSSFEFLSRVRKYGDEHTKLNEQECIRDIINNNLDDEQKQTLWIPQWKINAFPKEIRCYDKSQRSWERGLFTVHFAGAWAHIKEEDPTGFLMRKYEIEIDHR